MDLVRFSGTTERERGEKGRKCEEKRGGMRKGGLIDFWPVTHVGLCDGLEKARLRNIIKSRRRESDR